MKQIYILLAQALSYPGPGLLDELKEGLAGLGKGPGRNGLAAFIKKIGALSLEQWEELATGTLDLSPAAAPYVGFQVWGESYQRGAFMAQLNRAMAELDIDPGGELPDHLAPVLRYLAAADAPLPELAGHLQTAVGKMIAILRERSGATRTSTSTRRCWQHRVGNKGIIGGTMDWNTLFFVILPYIALALAIVVTIYRSVYRPFSISSQSSQLLERRKLFWGSISFHWGITIILAGHLLALLVPQSIVLWNAHPLRLYLLEISGIALGLWATAGLVILIWRRVTVGRIRVVSTPMDYVVLALLLVSLITGVITATVYRWGSYWFTGIFTPYIWSILTFRPDAAPLVDPAVHHQAARLQLLPAGGGVPVLAAGAYHRLAGGLSAAAVAGCDRARKPRAAEE